MSNSNCSSEKGFPRDLEENVPSVSTDQMREIDRIAIEEFGITLPQMMENAGRLLASLSRSVALSQLGSKVFVLAGKGNNGGGGLVAARHLHNWGYDVSVVLSANSEVFKGAPRQQLEIARKLGLPMLVPFHQDFLDTAAESLMEASLIIDALIGYGLRGDPRGTTSDLIEVANRSPTPVLALDVPSGLDATTGRIHKPCMEAEWTLTLALPKTGLLRREAKGVVGNLFLGDIGIPKEVYRRVGVEWVFPGHDLLRIVG